MTNFNHTTKETIEAAVRNRVSLYRANLEGANLEGANLEGANLEGAYLYRANLYRANLYRANLYRANLEGAYLYRANLEGANLEGANLEGAYLCRANLYRANLEGANLDGAYLYRANLVDCQMNWQSHDLIAARLRQEAEKTDNEALYSLAAGFVLINRDYEWCWKQLLSKFPTGGQFDEIRSWVLETMRLWVLDGEIASVHLQAVQS